MESLLLEAMGAGLPLPACITSRVDSAICLAHPGSPLPAPGCPRDPEPEPDSECSKRLPQPVAEVSLNKTDGGEIAQRGRPRVWQELRLLWETVLCCREHQGLGECQGSGRR